MSALMLLASSGGFLYWLIATVLWIVVMVWIYNIAKRKGRHPVGWLILGFFFTIISLIVLLLLPSKRETESRS